MSERREWKREDIGKVYVFVDRHMDRREFMRLVSLTKAGNPRFEECKILRRQLHQDAMSSTDEVRPDLTGRTACFYVGRWSSREEEWRITDTASNTMCDFSEEYDPEKTYIDSWYD